MVLLETERLLLKTIDVNLLDAASKRDHQAIIDLGYKTNGEWPNSDFFKQFLIFTPLLKKASEVAGDQMKNKNGTNSSSFEPAPLDD
ncbi:hypothetical protein [Bacillus mojavensis]|uniref:hypothetical protein n=1 Tax=Bacillus mojavensis TaxID=72360 RepID=UPI00398BB39B